jgi:uncharacterized membrane protein
MRLLLPASLAFLAASTVAGGAARMTERVLDAVVLPDYRSDWYTVPTSINDRGEIAGYAFGEGDDEWVAFVRTRAGRDRAIARSAYTHDLNNHGVVVGTRVTCAGDDCGLEGYVWSRRDGLASLGSFYPFAVNDRGDMAGVCSDGLWRACVMRDGVVSPIAGDGSEARAINARGDVAGSYGDNRAFLLTAGWRFRDIGRGAAEAISDRGTVAGQRYQFLGERGERGVATVWTKRGARSPAREASTATAINRRGWVIVNAWDEHEETYSFVWNPATRRRLMLGSADGGWVFVEDINSHGTVVGTAGIHGAMWRVSARDLNAPAR